MTVAAPPPLSRRLTKGIRARFRLHTDEHAAPAGARLLGVTSAAAGCVFVGIIPAARLIASVAIGGPWWYQMMTLVLGIVGLGFLTAAFSAIHRRLLPWYLVGAAALLLTANVTLVYVI